MKFLFASYIRSPQFNHPVEWIHRIRAYTGVLESLAKQHEVVSIEQINYSGDHFQNGVRYHFMDFGRKKLYFPCALHRFIKRQAPDIILIHGTVFPLQVIQLRLKMGNRVKIILQSHENQTPRGYRILLQKIADTCVNAYFFTSQYGAGKLIEKGMIANKNKVYEVMVGSSVFYPLPKEEARMQTGIKNGTVFLWAGKLDQNKDPVTVVKAFLQFAAFCPDVMLYMIYQSDELLEGVNYLLENDPAKNAVVLIGKVAHNDMLYWFNSADFLLSGSHAEVFGAVVSEAMSCGCIPVVTGIPSFQKITAQACGILYEAGNEQSLLNALQRAITLDREAETQKVLAQFAKHLSFDAIANKIQEIAGGL